MSFFVIVVVVVVVVVVVNGLSVSYSIDYLISIVIQTIPSCRKILLVFYQLKTQLNRETEICRSYLFSHTQKTKQIHADNICLQISHRDRGIE
jgi:hypothetical protein